MTRPWPPKRSYLMGGNDRYIVGVEDQLVFDVPLGADAVVLETLGAN